DRLTNTPLHGEVRDDLSDRERSHPWRVDEAVRTSENAKARDPWLRRASKLRASTTATVSVRAPVVNLKHVDCPTRSGSARTSPAPISCWLVFVRPFGSHGRNQTLRKPADARCTSADGAVAVPGSAR